MAGIEDFLGKALLSQLYEPPKPPSKDSPVFLFGHPAGEFVDEGEGWKPLEPGTYSWTDDKGFTRSIEIGQPRGRKRL